MSDIEAMILFGTFTVVCFLVVSIISWRRS